MEKENRRKMYTQVMKKGKKEKKESRRKSGVTSFAPKLLALPTETRRTKEEKKKSWGCPMCTFNDDEKMDGILWLENPYILVQETYFKCGEGFNER